MLQSHHQSTASILGVQKKVKMYLSFTRDDDIKDDMVEFEKI